MGGVSQPQWEIGLGKRQCPLLENVFILIEPQSAWNVRVGRRSGGLNLEALYTVSQKKTSHFNFRHNLAIC